MKKPAKVNPTTKPHWQQHKKWRHLKSVQQKPYLKLKSNWFVACLRRLVFYDHFKKLIYKKQYDVDNNDVIQFRDVSFTYNLKTPYEFNALKNINLTFQDHDIVAVIGSTGSGKSTLIQHMNGLLIPTQGTLDAYGFSIFAKQKKIPNVKDLRQKIGVVFQFAEYQLFESTVMEDIIFGPICMGLNKDLAKVAAHKYLQMVGMAEHFLQQSPFDLSGGQKRRVAVAGILAMEGDTLVLDEPTAGLDPDGEKNFLKLFKRLNQERKKRIILVTHNMNNVLEIADQVVVMDQGEIITVGAPSKVFSQVDIMQQLQIELPQIQKFMVKLKARKIIDLFGESITNVDALATSIAAKLVPSQP